MTSTSATEEFRTLKHQPRLVSKNSLYNIKHVGTHGKGKYLMHDFFTTMVDTKWRWNVLIFVSGFVITWLLFALFYWLVSKLHGDLNDVKTTSLRPCFENVNSFTAAYLFSIETQTTIGYGFRYDRRMPVRGGRRYTTKHRGGGSTGRPSRTCSG